jgi:hypothetical protein
VGAWGPTQTLTQSSFFRKKSHPRTPKNKSNDCRRTPE